MTDRPGPFLPGPAPQGPVPPASIDPAPAHPATVDPVLLAELHAGVLDDATAAELTARVVTDADARAVLRALDATVADLAVLGESPVAVRVPPAVSDRLDAALAAVWAPANAAPVATAAAATVVDLAAARRARAGRRRLLGAGAVAVAAAAVAVVVLGGLVGGGGATPGSAVAAPLDLGDGRLGTTVLASLGTTDLGPLTDPATLAGCLGANDVPPGAPVLGSAQVVVRGERGTLLLLTTGRAGAFRALVVGPGCSATDPALLADQQIGGR